MKKKYKVSINKPCPENWKNFTPNSTGGYCSSCQKNVTDFTKMSDNEVINFLSNSSGSNCGRLTHSQLQNNYREPLKSKKKLGLPILKASIAGASLLFVTQNSLAQSSNDSLKTETVQTEHQQLQLSNSNINSFIISGLVVDEEGYPIPGVYVSLKGTTELVITDIDGKFNFPKELNTGDVLVISFIGFETLEHKIAKENSKNITLKLTLDTRYVLMGEVAMEEIYVSKPLGIRGVWSKIKNIF